ncbi:MAG: pyridoxal phosphate-dependent aminotransferase [Actinomycetaceae bacterium]|nr:pyridoxal phosphate-dependent aminotransferase [Actinomycetaceae bacterium]MDY5854603.1 pyridoxal phosphate-dependent aminotransferase [Arcanobacterium sp.]
MPSFSDRSSPAGAGANAVARAESAARAQGTELLHLSDANPAHSGLTPASLPRSYDPDPRGRLADRQLVARAVSQWWAQPTALDPQRLYLLSSTSQAYSWLFKLLCDPGDVVLAPAPGYPLIEQIARLENVQVSYYRLAMHERWAIDTAHIEQLLVSDRAAQGRIKAIVVINPGNPTGAYVHADERERLVQLCSRFDLALIADEVFWGYPLEGVPACGDCAAQGSPPYTGRARLTGESRVLTFGLDGLSKNLGAPGAKLAWIYVSGSEAAVDEVQRRLDAIADAFLPISDIISAHLPQLLAGVPEQREYLSSRCRENLAMVQKMVAHEPSGVTTVLTPEGGWSALIRFPATIDEDELVTALIAGVETSTDAHGQPSFLSARAPTAACTSAAELAAASTLAVTVQPGYFFDMPIAGFVCISLLLEPQQLAVGVSALLAEIARRAQE